jgi:hypothetical protein
MAGGSDWRRLETILTRDDPPHVILVGAAGSGKSCALRLALGSKICMWLRCSQDPTLRESRDRIKAAARRRVEAGHVNWVVLEHADLLHADAQAFLRRIIETSMGASRFVLEVRDVAAIAEPLLSRTVLFNAPQLVDYEIRTEIMRRAPSITLDAAARLAAESSGNIRWAILQALGGGNGFIDDTVARPDSITDWAGLLHAMEDLQRTGTSPRAWLRDGRTVWERPGGACPWALTAATLAGRFVPV